jgi:hypothetical protein
MPSDDHILAEAIRCYLARYQHIALEPERLLQLGNEVAALNERVRAAAARLTFDDEPFSYQGQLRQLSNEPGPDNP